MTSIKPPGAGAPHDNLPAGHGTSSSAGSSTVEANPPSSSTVAAPTKDAIAALSAGVEAGTLKMAEAVDKIVERHLASAGKYLTPDQTAELRALLQAAAATDPTLLAMSENG